MGKFKIIPISKEYTKKIRDTRRDDFGHHVVEEIATGLGPCRISLRTFTPGKDKRLVLSHSPFSIDNAFNQPGPIFIFSDDVAEYADINIFPPDIKRHKDRIVLTLIGYSKEQRMVYTELVGDRDVDEFIEEIFDTHADVEYLHARSAKACCYLCRIERA